MNSSPMLLAESVSTRRPPGNLEPYDLWLFEHELERTLPGARLLELRDIRASADGFLFKSRGRVSHQPAAVRRSIRCLRTATVR